MKNKTILYLFLCVSLTKPAFSLDSLYIFPAANKICEKIFSNVELIEKSYNYSYSVQSLECSEQQIWDFRLETKSVNNNIVSPTNWIAIISELKFRTINWGVADSNYFIKKNGELSGFKVNSTGLPSICDYFAAGFVPMPVFPLGEEPQVINNDIYENCKRGYTIGPKDPPDPFIPLNFLDTLLNYNQRSYELGWIANQSIADKYTGYFTTAKTQLQQNNIIGVNNTLQNVLQEVNQDSSGNITSEAYALLRYNTEYLLENLPEPVSNISTYSLFATHSLWLKQNSDVLSGDVGVNEAGSPPFLDSQLELSIGIGTTTPAGYTVKTNRIKVKQSSTVNGDVYYNELDNKGTITGSQNTPLELPLVTTLPEFKTSTPGTEDIVIPQNGEQTLQPGSYGDIQVKKNGRLIFTGGEYHINSFNGGDNNQIVFQSPSEVKIADKFDSGQGSYIGPEDPPDGEAGTTTVGAKDIIFYVGGINGNNGNLGATPKAAKIGISNTVKANFYVPNGTLWIREHSEAEGAFIGKDVIVGIGVEVKINSAY